MLNHSGVGFLLTANDLVALERVLSRFLCRIRQAKEIGGPSPESSVKDAISWNKTKDSIRIAKCQCGTKLLVPPDIDSDYEEGQFFEVAVGNDGGVLICPICQDHIALINDDCLESMDADYVGTIPADRMISCAGCGVRAIFAPDLGWEPEEWKGYRVGPHIWRSLCPECYEAEKDKPAVDQRISCSVCGRDAPGDYSNPKEVGISEEWTTTSTGMWVCPKCSPKIMRKLSEYPKIEIRTGSPSKEVLDGLRAFIDQARSGNVYEISLGGPDREPSSTEQAEDALLLIEAQSQALAKLVKETINFIEEIVPEERWPCPICGRESEGDPIPGVGFVRVDGSTDGAPCWYCSEIEPYVLKIRDILDRLPT